MSSFLPPEIYDRVFSSVSYDIHTIRSCTLVHRSWTREAQRVLFRDLCIQIGTLDKPRQHLSQTITSASEPDSFEWTRNASTSAFLAMIRASPYIAQYITSVHLNLSDIYRENHSGVRCSVHAERHSTTDKDIFATQWSYEDLLAAILDAPLTQVHTISISAYACPSDCKEPEQHMSDSTVASYGEFPSLSRVSIEALQFALKNVRTVRFGTSGAETNPIQLPMVQTLIRFLSCFPSLTEFVMGSVQVIEGFKVPDAQFQHDSIFMGLEQLTLANDWSRTRWSSAPDGTVRCHWELLDWLKSTHTRATLRELQVHQWHEGCANQSFFDSLATTLYPWSMRFDCTSICKLSFSR
jgi:hypothetical protein